MGQLAERERLMTEAYAIRVLDALRPNHATAVRNHDGTNVLVEPSEPWTTERPK
jgi:hypothetical protein